MQRLDDPLSSAEKSWRKKTVASALGSLRLENLKPSLALLQDLDRWTDGSLLLDDVGRRLFARFEREDSAGKEV